MVTICVEGNIASGKTTFLNHFRNSEDMFVMDEPSKNVRGQDLLGLWHKDPVKWSFCLQSYVQLTMVDLHTRPVTEPFKIMEGSIYSAKNCFTKNLHNAGVMKDAEYTVLTEWFDFCQENMKINVDLIVYLQTDPLVVYERRSGDIELQYLQSVHDLYEDWLIKKNSYLPCPALVIDANVDFDMDSCEKAFCEILGRV